MSCISIQRWWPVACVMLSLATPVLGQDESLSEQLKVVTNPKASVSQRKEAERLILDRDAYSCEFLKEVFTILQQPASMHPGTGALEMDATLMPVESQIGYATSRVWAQVVKLAGPDALRRDALANLFDELDPNRKGDHARMSKLINCINPYIREGEVGDNWSEKAERQFVRIFEQRGWPAGSGIHENEVAERLLSPRAAPRIEKYYELVIRRAVERKGTGLGDQLLWSVLGSHDVRVSRLVLDKYHGAKDAAARRSVLHLIEQHFTVKLEPARSDAMPVMSDAWVSAFDKAGRDWVSANETAARNGTYVSPKRRERLEKEERMDNIKEWWDPGSTTDDKEDGG